MTRTALQAVMTKEPTLAHYGILLFSRAPGHAERFTTERTALLEDVETFALACQWLAPMTNRQTINTRHSSYELKHIAEKDLGHYVANGTINDTGALPQYIFLPLPSRVGHTVLSVIQYTHQRGDTS